MAIQQAENLSIGVVFDTRHPFILSSNQRPYSWTEDEVDTYCKDLKGISTEYFFGGIVCVHNLAPTGPGRIHRVVDGQQRLATFTLTIVHLKNAFQQLKNLAIASSDKTVELSASAIYDQLVKDYLIYTDTKPRPPVDYYRLKLSDLDNKFFQDLIEGKNPTATAVSHEKILYAYNTIFKELIDPIINGGSLTLNEKLDELEKLKDKLLDHAVVILIITDHLSDAYQLYEVLNDRGKELEIGDFLRSSTLELLEGNATIQSAVSKYWDEILSREGIEKFLKVYFSSIYGSVKSTSVHKQYEEKFFNYQLANMTLAQQQKIHDDIKDILEYFNVYQNIKNGIWPYSTTSVNGWKKNRLSLLINQLEHTMCISLLLSIYRSGTEGDFLAAVKSIEKTAFRYISASGLRANSLGDIYRKHIRLINQNNTFNLTPFNTDLNSLISNYCNDSVFKAGIKKLSYSRKNIKKIRYFLTTLEDHFNWYSRPTRTLTPRPNVSVIHSMDSIDIEHIYPQNAQTVIRALESKKNDIGNLTYWSPSDNRSLKNADFSVKKPFYASSHVAITRELDNVSTWSITDANNRLRLYQDMACVVFKIY